ncbi:MAG TPA: pyridoxamine 5'-phosphate oxidase [Pseudomonadales bacterium]|nr:pyridoxamine 5'-phosphate oxidase [Pseudomonadales bacterium]
MKTADIRRDYQYGELRRADLAPEPFTQFEQWLGEALQHPHIPDPTAMVLATVNSQGQPHQRTVLLKDHGPHGFTFFTNLDSHKAQDIAVQTRVSLLFQWLSLSRQVIINGTVTRTDRVVDEQYFASRPRDSQLAAWASRQSQALAERHVLDEAFAAQKVRFGDGTIPCPPNWGGYCVQAQHVEFWQGRPNRLHDRLTYERDGSDWNILRLSP